ncbi:MAG: hypothetical protein JJU08_01655 [Rhodobacteraceae bacterium]|nr:hypothetical protein [Paracoccaceae bacterium]
MADAWFKPMAHGSGARPANWRGWAALAAYVGALVLLATHVFGGVMALPMAVVFFVGMSVMMTAGFIVLVWAQVRRHKPGARPSR